MRVHVAFTPAETISAPVGIVVDVLRATSTIAQALGAGYERVFCCREVEDAVALHKELGTGLLGGERSAVKIEGFDVGASPREFLEARDEPVIFSTTNGTRAILAAAGRCDGSTGSLLNLTPLRRRSGAWGGRGPCAQVPGGVRAGRRVLAGGSCSSSTRARHAANARRDRGGWPDPHRRACPQYGRPAPRTTCVLRQVDCWPSCRASSACRPCR